MDMQTAESLMKFVEEAGPKLRGFESKVVFEQLERQYTDMLAAFHWLLAEKLTDEALRLAIALVPFWMATKRLDEGSTLLDQALALLGGNPEYRGRALFHAGYLRFLQGDDKRSGALQNTALELGRQTKNPTVTALALAGLARIALRTDIGEARRLCREALAVTEGTTDQVGRFSAMHILGVVAQMTGDFLEARQRMTERIALARQMENFATVGTESGNLSMVERQLGNLKEAEELAREALDICYRRGDEVAIPWMFNQLAAVAAERGELDRAALLIGVADSTMEASGGTWPPDEKIHYERTRGIIQETMSLDDFDALRRSGSAMTTPDAVRFALGPR